ncbi:alcohol dehydrogenase catalytic domain-containing protein [Mumia quercus]|uniref:alcohol dehydrogenase catalytic domain-containing protein n=1 Tax=Mumia quercus TaxID=2976125 RepID=UPI0021CE09B1|nr:zinc-binding dehydrogenase [Mumia quercus]
MPSLRPDDVQVQVAAAGWTFFDSFVAADHATLGLPDLIGLGFDFSGTVVAVGVDVTDLAVGDRVAGLHADPTAPARAHAEHVVVPSTHVAPLPAGLDLETAAAIPLNALAARQALDLLGAPRGSLLVIGAAGGVGTWATALAVREGWTVDALVKPGTEHLVDPLGAKTALTAARGRSYDAAIDAAGLQQASLAYVADGGRFVGVKPGWPVPPERDIAVSAITTTADGPALSALLPLAADGTVPVRIAGRRPLSEAAAAYAEAADAPGSAGRWILVP